LNPTLKTETRAETTETETKKAFRWWSAEEEAFLKENYSRLSVRELSQILCRTPDAIKEKARKLGLRKVRWWTKEEERYLLENYSLRQLKEIARELGRTKSAVEHKIHKLRKKNKVSEKKSRVVIPPYLRRVLEQAGASQAEIQG